MEPATSTEPKSSVHLKSRALLVLAALAAATSVGLVIYIGNADLISRTAKQPIKAKTAPVAQAPAPRFQLSLFASGLANPTAIASAGAAADTRLFVVSQDGLINIVSSNGTKATTPFLDIQKLVNFNGEMGLLGLAFSPHYATDGYLYVDYVDHGPNTVIARYHISKDTNVADPASAQILLTVKQPYPNHKGGQLAFGPDGYLYIGLGDGGGAGDPGNRAQNLGTLLGKILRLDVSQVPYKVPATNPFIGRDGALPEIWGYGLRNPWRFSFDRRTGDLYIADVGQSLHEEINVEASGNKGGNNYGWRCYEGLNDFNLAGCTTKTNYVFPIATYDHTDSRCSVTGGYVYRGTKDLSLTGTYFYADYCGGQLYELQKHGNTWVPSLALQTPYKISTFGQDNTGELYLADYSTGAIYQIQTISQAD